MSGYQFTLTCPRCGGHVDHREDTASRAPLCSSVEAWCAECMVRWLITVEAVVLDELSTGDWRQRARERAIDGCTDDGRKVMA